MKGKAIDLYRRAFENDETLAAANISYTYLDGGFMSDADALLTEASKRESVHQNVALARSTLARRRSEESDRWSEVLSIAVKQQLFMSGFADALVRHTSDAWKDIGWTTHDRREARIQDVDGQLVCEWADDAGQNRRRMKLDLTGDAATLSLEKWIQTSYLSGGSGYFGDGLKGAAYLSPDKSEIRMMLVDDKSASFVTWSSKPRLLAVPEPKQLGAGDAK